jgi:hypothetical protein
MPLTLSSTGSGSFVDLFDRANGALGSDWTVPSGYAAAIVSNRARLTGRGLNEVVVASGASSSATGYAEFIVSAVDSGAEIGVLLRYGGGHYLAQFFGGNLTLFRGPTGFTSVTSVAFALVVGQQYRVHFYAATGEQKVWVDGVLKISASDTAAGSTGGTPAFRSTINAKSMECDQIRRFAGKSVTVTNLPTGYKARVKDAGGSVVAGPATESGGTATLDVGGVALPYASVEVLDAGGSVVSGATWTGSGYPQYSFAYSVLYTRTTNTYVATGTLAISRALRQPRTTNTAIAAATLAVSRSLHLRRTVATAVAAATLAVSRGLHLRRTSNTHSAAATLVLSRALHLRRSIATAVAPASLSVSASLFRVWSVFGSRPASMFAAVPRGGGRSSLELVAVTAPLYADEFARADGPPGAGWLASNSAIVSGRLRVTGRGLDDTPRAEAAETRSSEYIEVQVAALDAGAEVGILARHPGSYYLAQFLGGNLRLYRGPAGYTQVASVAFALVVGQQYRVHFYAATGEQKVWVDGVLVLSAADVAAGSTPGRPGFRSSINTKRMEAEFLRTYAGRLARVTALPTGYKARVKDAGGSVVAGPATESGGTATLDVGGVALPYASVEVLDAGGSVVSGATWTGSGYPEYEFEYAGPWSAPARPVSPWTE